MWKTRFEMSTNINYKFIRQRNLLSSSSSSIKIHYSSCLTSTVPRVKENSPTSSLVRSSSSAPNLECVFEEETDDDNQCSDSIDIEQQNPQIKTSRSSNSSNKYQTVLPTIIESNDSETSHDNDQQQQQNSIVHCQLKTNFLFEQQIQDLLQCNAKFSSSHSNKNDNYLSNSSENHSIERKKFIRAKRSILSKRDLLTENQQILLSNPNKDRSVFYRQVKRLKTTHNYEIKGKHLSIRLQLMILFTSCFLSICFYVFYTNTKTN